MLISRSEMSIASINPATGETLDTFSELNDQELEGRLALAARTFKTYRRTSLDDRKKWITRAAEILETEKQAFGRIMTLEMGKPLADAVAEAAKCATACRYYAEHAEAILKDQDVATNASHSYVHFQPIGVVLAVMPWNFPFWQVFRFAAPALMAGNVGLLKHSSNVPQCALAIEDVLQRAGFPQGAFQSLLIGSARVARLLDDPRIAAATLTGSEPAGIQVATGAGKNIKKTVLELGGSDPFIVMPSADLNVAIPTAVKARCINNGQSCIAAKRFFAPTSIYAEFEKRFVEGMKALKVGDPMDSATQIGPLATPQGANDLDDQVKRAIASGAKLLCGGTRIARAGNYFEPTVLAGIDRGNPVFYEEIFGPVAMLFEVKDLDEAIELANDSPFGLGASAWTNDPSERARFIDELEAGLVFINGMVASDARLPFGGTKHSGYGRELGAFGILEFVNIKTVWIG